MSTLLESHHRLLDLLFFLRRFRDDLIALVVAVATYAIAAYFLESPWTLFGLSVGISVVAAIVIVSLKSRRRGFIWLSMRGRDHGEGWIGQGGLAYARTEEGYRITQSHDGVILAETLGWSDYRLRFMFRIESVSLGVIMRAGDLGNLVMLQIFPDRVKAHIRVNGAWLVWDQVPSLTFPEPLALGRWYACDVVCDKRNLRMMFSTRGENRGTLTWSIPGGNVVLGAGGGQIEGVIRMPFMVNYDYGAVGFRNDGGESAVVRHVLVERL